jgi:GH15 family glucan-1,4-alpha-glucosidase
MAWVALDRGIRSAERLGPAAPVSHWRGVRAAIHREVCERGFDADRGAFTQALDSNRLDASVLLLPHVGFIDARDARMVGTVEAVRRELVRDGFVRRYRPSRTDDGLGEHEGAFLACSFWLVDTLVLQGRRVEAEALFRRVLAVRNDVGLLSEEYDPGRGRLLGNFPQALSHLSLVNSARALEGHGAAQQRSR